MNVTEFAERIVFGNTLDDKLLVAEKLSDEHSGRSGPNVETLFSPGRPVGLEMRHDKVGHAKGGARPPADSELENETARGQLLHFLANHELLATELMALVLLKFPEAPDEFRRGILATLREEQAHTRMYLQRMQECGVEFGSFPLSGQFWRLIEPMQSPMEFVSRLSLTFEQANLDYSLHFAKVFGHIGDTKTAGLLNQIYLDEIGHVQHGLHWFRQWKDPQQSDWEAYQSTLEFPMSPQRGRGPRGAFNREGRLQAGLDENFIDTIEVFRQSRGRAPTVHWFDPAAETELAGESTSRTEKLMDQLAKDLELILLAMARQDDVVLVRRVPSKTLRRHWIDMGFQLPEFLPLQDRSVLGQRKLHDFSPWAWTPKNDAIANSFANVTYHSTPDWREDWRELYRKSWSANCLRSWLADSDCPDWFASTTSTGILVSCVDDVRESLHKLSSKSFETAIFKLDFGTSGRVQRRLDCEQSLGAEDIAWLESAFAAQDLGIVEPYLDRQVDFSFLWRIRSAGEEPELTGWTRPLVAPGRRYTGTRFGSTLFDCDQRIKRFVLANRCARLQTVIDWLQPKITNELRKRNFIGYFGVDAFLYKDSNDALKIKPLVELNPRMTMGHVAINLAKKLSPGAEAEFRILTKSEWKAVQASLESVPFTRTSDGCWKTGVVRFSEADDNTKLVPVLLIGKTAVELVGKHGQPGASEAAVDLAPIQATTS